MEDVRALRARETWLGGRLPAGLKRGRRQRHELHVQVVEREKMGKPALKKKKVLGGDGKLLGQRKGEIGGETRILETS